MESFFSSTAYPDVQIHDINEDWEFVLLASDGIWDVMTNEDVVRLCLRKIEMGIPPETICEELMTKCLSPDVLLTGTDNMTVVLICFLHNKPYEDLSKRAKEINKREQKMTDELQHENNDSYSVTATTRPRPFNGSKDDDQTEKERPCMDDIAADRIGIEVDIDESMVNAADGQPGVILSAPQDLGDKSPSNRETAISGMKETALPIPVNDAKAEDEGTVQEH